MALPPPRIRGLALHEHLRGRVHGIEPPRRSGTGRANLVDVVDRPQQLQVDSYQSHWRLVDPRGVLWVRGKVLSRRRGGGEEGPVVVFPVGLFPFDVLGRRYTDGGGGW